LRPAPDGVSQGRWTSSSSTCTPTHNPHRWFLPWTPSICVGPPASCSCSAASAWPRRWRRWSATCERPLIWATAQYLSYARPGSVVDIDVWTPVEGKYNTQARVISHVDDKEIITVNAALGARESPYSRTGPTGPTRRRRRTATPPSTGARQRGGLHSRMEVRIVKGRRGPTARAIPEADGRSLSGARPRGGLRDRFDHAGDHGRFVPQGIGAALGKNAGGNRPGQTPAHPAGSCDRLGALRHPDRGVHGGFGHGVMYPVSQDGELMASGQPVGDHPRSGACGRTR
jgi:hypothetical protein